MDAVEGMPAAVKHAGEYLGIGLDHIVRPILRCGIEGNILRHQIPFRFVIFLRVHRHKVGGGGKEHIVHRYVEMHFNAAVHGDDLRFPVGDGGYVAVPIHDGDVLVGGTPCNAFRYGRFAQKHVDFALRRVLLARSQAEVHVLFGRRLHGDVFEGVIEFQHQRAVRMSDAFRYVAPIIRVEEVSFDVDGLRLDRFVAQTLFVRSRIQNESVFFKVVNVMFHLVIGVPALYRARISFGELNAQIVGIHLAARNRGGAVRHIAQAGNSADGIDRPVAVVLIGLCADVVGNIRVHRNVRQRAALDIVGEDAERAVRVRLVVLQRPRRPYVHRNRNVFDDALSGDLLAEQTAPRIGIAGEIDIADDAAVHAREDPVGDAADRVTVAVQSAGEGRIDQLNVSVDRRKIGSYVIPAVRIFGNAFGVGRIDLRKIRVRTDKSGVNGGGDVAAYAVIGGVNRNFALLFRREVAVFVHRHDVGIGGGPDHFRILHRDAEFLHDDGSRGGNLVRIEVENITVFFRFDNQPLFHIVEFQRNRAAVVGNDGAFHVADIAFGKDVAFRRLRRGGRRAADGSLKIFRQEQVVSAFRVRFVMLHGIGSRPHFHRAGAVDKLRGLRQRGKLDSRVIRIDAAVFKDAARGVGSAECGHLGNHRGCLRRSVRIDVVGDDGVHRYVAERAALRVVEKTAGRAFPPIRGVVRRLRFGKGDLRRYVLHEPAFEIIAEQTAPVTRFAFQRNVADRAAVNAHEQPAVNVAEGVPAAVQHAAELRAAFHVGIIQYAFGMSRIGTDGRDLDIVCEQIPALRPVFPFVDRVELFPAADVIGPHRYRAGNAADIVTRRNGNLAFRTRRNIAVFVHGGDFGIGGSPHQFFVFLVGNFRFVLVHRGGQLHFAVVSVRLKGEILFFRGNFVF